jgi:glutathione S-transferase
VLDAVFAKAGDIVGGRFTVTDINVSECVRYAQAASAVFDAAPNVMKWLAACQARPAFNEMWTKRDAEPA